MLGNCYFRINPFNVFTGVLDACISLSLMITSNILEIIAKWNCDSDYLPGKVKFIRFSFFFFKCSECVKLEVCEGEVHLKWNRWVPLHGWKRKVCNIAVNINSEQVEMSIVCLRKFKNWTWVSSRVEIFCKLHTKSSRNRFWVLENVQFLEELWCTC